MLQRLNQPLASTLTLSTRIKGDDYRYQLVELLVNKSLSFTF